MRINSCSALAIALFLALVDPISAGEKLNVVYHVADAEKASFALNNIRNHIEGVGGPQNVNIVLVVHGPALQAFNDIEAVDTVRNNFKVLHEQGVQFNACGNTLKVFDLELSELLPGFVEVSQGGVTRIAELQSQGYVYIRP